MKEYLLILDKSGFGIYFPTVMAAYEAARTLKITNFKIYYHNDNNTIV